MASIKKILLGYLISFFMATPSFANTDSVSTKESAVVVFSDSTTKQQSQLASRDMTNQQANSTEEKNIKKPTIRNVVLITAAAITVVGMAIFLLWWIPGGNIK